MTIAKLLLLIVVVAAGHYGSTSPNVRPPDEQLREQHGAEVMVLWSIMLTKTLLWTWTLFEASVLFALSDHCPPALAQSFLRSLYFLPPGSTAPPSLGSLSLLTNPTPAFIAGAALALSGALLRTHCYAVLGRHFTFELTIRPAHALVTSGVYGVVRHPSYTGGTGLAVGWMMCVLDPRGVGVRVGLGAARAWARTWGLGLGSGFEDDQGQGERALTALLAWAWATGFSVMVFVLRWRMDKEDAMLEDNFGEEWRAWARRVPYRMVPGVY